MTAVVRCARCGESWTAQVWNELPVEQTLRAQDLAGYVSAWPADAVVHVRTCTGCGGRVARRVDRR